MKALVLKEYLRFSYEDAPEPEHGPGDVLIRVGACGICGSDIHGMDGSSGRRVPPLIMGHEAAGDIVATGERVSGWECGDRVTFDSMVSCGECWYCRRGKTNLCETRNVVGVSTGEYRRHGAFAEFITVPARILHRIPDNVSFEQAAMTEPLSIGVHAAARTPCEPGDVAVVIGAGMIGVLLLQVLKPRGYSKVIAVDLDDSRLELARRLGADTVLNGERDSVDAMVRDLTGGRGADAVFEVVGIEGTVQLGVDCVRKGGFLTLVGNLAPRVDFPLQSVVTREISVCGTCGCSGEYPECLELIASGKVDVETFVSAQAPLSEGAEWFDRLHKGERGLMKVLLKP